MILSCWNANKESGPDFSILSVFQAKGRFEGKNCPFSVAHKTWLKSWGTKDYHWQQNLNFTHESLQEMRFEFQKVTFRRKLKNWLISNHCFYRLVRCISMKLSTFVWWYFLVITNKSARICCDIFLRFCNPEFEKCKKQESDLVSKLRQEKLADLFLVFPARLEAWPKVFHSYSFIKVVRNKKWKKIFIA